MFKPLSLFIGLRYTRAKRKNHFISFISLMSMIGIALGVAVLITVLSVMNGFDSHIRERVFGMAPALTVTGQAGSLTNWQTWQTRMDATQGVLASAPFVDGQGLLRAGNQVAGVEIQGIIPEQENKISDINQKVISGSFGGLSTSNFGIVLGKSLAENLGVAVGDKIILFIPQLTVSPAGITPRFKRFTVIGIFSAGSGFGFDSNLAFINLNNAQALWTMPSSVTGLKLKVADMFAAPMMGNRIMNQYPNLDAEDWTQTYGPLFKAVALEKTMMFLILMLIIAVAVFNLVSSLVMAVTDKQSDIAILRTMGATPAFIMRVFIVQGSLIGVIGTLIGLVVGVLLALNVTSIVNGIQQLLHTQLFQSSVYYMDYLPSELKVSDVAKIVVSALIMSLLATLYPAWRAANVKPAEALRYE